MKGVISASVSAGSSQRVASVTWTANVTVLVGWAKTGDARRMTRAAERRMCRHQRCIAPPAQIHRPLTISALASPLEASGSARTASALASALEASGSARTATLSPDGGEGIDGSLSLGEGEGRGEGVTK